MKKLLLLFLLIPSLLFAQDWQEARMSLGVVAGGVPTGVTCDDCSGSRIWSSHFEGTGNSGQTFDITTGDPCGCSDDASKVITYYNNAVNSTTQKSDGSYSFKKNNATADNATSPLTNGTTTVISIQFDVYFTIWVADYIFARAVYDANNRLIILMTSTDEIGVSWAGNSNSKAATSATWDIALNTWYTIRAQGRTTASPYIRATLNGGSAITGTSATTAMTNAYNLVQLGSTAVNTGTYYIDNVHVWNDWQTGTVWGD